MNPLPQLFGTTLTIGWLYNAALPLDQKELLLMQLHYRKQPLYLLVGISTDIRRIKLDTATILLILQQISIIKTRDESILETDFR